MALRMIELFLPAEDAEGLRRSFEESNLEVHGIWSEGIDDGKKLIRILVDAGDCEAVIDEFAGRFGTLEDYRLVILPVEATLPRPDEPETAKPREEKRSDRINREELYADILDMAKLDPVFLVMVALSTIVAAVGLVRDSPVIVLSAMVIAPLLGPNLALALATTLGDRELSKAGIKSATSGFLLAIALSVGIGMTIGVDPDCGEISSRTHASLGDIVLALAAGAAGAISITSGAGAALIGVMVAVALLPPTVVTGILLGHGNFRLAPGAAELVAINLVCLILAAIVVFVTHGIRPATWWEAEQAKRSTRRALLAGGMLLLVLAILLLLRQFT